MLTCREVAERADGWIADDPSAWQALKMRLRLAMCNGCARPIGQMRVLRNLTVAAAQFDVDETHDTDDGRISSILFQLHERKQSGG